MWTAGTPLKDISHKICAEDSIPAELWSKNLPASSVFEREALPLDLVLFSALDLSYCERSGGEPMSHWLQVWFPLKGHPFSWDSAIQRNRGLATSVLYKVLLDCQPPGFTGQFPNCADESNLRLDEIWHHGHLNWGIMPLPCLAPGMQTNSRSLPAVRNLWANLGQSWFSLLAFWF